MEYGVAGQSNGVAPQLREERGRRKYCGPKKGCEDQGGP